MDIAIRMQKIELGNDRIVFKPIGIIKGTYDKNEQIFYDELDFQYSVIDETSMYEENYFWAPIYLEDLKEEYESYLSEEEILNEYLSEYINCYYLGYFDEILGKIKTIKIDFDRLEETLSNTKENTEETIEFDLEKNEKFVFDLKSLLSLKDYENIEDVRNFIDQLITAGEYVKNTVKSIENSQDRSLFEMDDSRVVEEEPKPKKVIKKEESKKFNLKNMRDFVLKEIVAQDEAVKSITTTIMKNMEATNPKMKSHILIMGPTGVGKTSTIELICKYLDVPFCKVDSTSYTQTGYVGRNTDEILQKLIYAANYNISKAQKGIIVIDEIDKKAKGDKDSIATTAVQQALLKLTGRGMVEVDIDYKGSKSTIDFDTSNLTIVFTGAFEGINKLNKKDYIKHIGFINDSKESKEEDNKITTSLLTQYGLIPELIGRIKKIVVLNPLKQKDYVQILNYSNNSPIKINKEFFELDKGIKVTFTDSFKIEAAKKAEEFNLGVRGLDRAVDDALEDAMERVLNNEKIKELKFTKSTVNNPKKYYSN